jgi:hypothetical protein
MVIFVYLLLAIVGLYFFDPVVHPKLAWGVFIGISALFFLVVWMKGEKRPK